MNVSLTTSSSDSWTVKVESGLYNNASEVIREGLRLLKEHDELRARVHASIERAWAQVRAGGDLRDGPTAMADARRQLTNRGKKGA